MAALAYRTIFDKKTQITPKSSSFSLSQLRKNGIAIVSASVIFGSFGALVAKAGDDSGVYDFIKSQSSSRSSAHRSSGLPPIFVPQPRYSRQSVSYAPSSNYDYAPRRFLPDYDMPNRHALKKQLRAEKRRYLDERKYSNNVIVAHNVSNVESQTRRIAQPIAYCVRLCDGYYFPIGTGSDNFDKHEASCNSMCPSSQTRVYVAPTGSDEIGKASHRGQTYAHLGTAYNYRQKHDKICSCNPASPAGGLGMFSPKPEEDVTLHRGDVVMTDAGFKSYAGGSAHYPHLQNEFISSGRSKALSSREQRYLTQLATGGRHYKFMTKELRKQKLLALKSASYQTNDLVKADYIPVEQGRVRNVAPYLGR